MSPQMLLIVASIATTFWIVGETVKGVRWVKHHVQSAVHHLVHPHEHHK